MAIENKSIEATILTNLPEERELEAQEDIELADEGQDDFELWKTVCSS